MKEYKKYIKEWQDLSIKLNEAMQKNNFDEADGLMRACNETYEKYKACSALPSSNKVMSFGELNYMLECELPRLFKENKEAIKECTNCIKSDPNLLSQFKFIDTLRNYNCDGNSLSYVHESIELASKGINRKTLRESVRKFAKILAKYEIGGYELNEDVKRYYQSCENVLCEGKKLSNLTSYTNNVNSIASYIENHKKPITEEKQDVNKLIEDFVKKLKKLNESDQNLVRDIIDFKQPGIEMRQENLFNKFKNECISTVNKLISESQKGDEQDGLKAIKSQLEGKTFCKESIIQDIAQLLEIRDILTEK